MNNKEKAENEAVDGVTVIGDWRLSADRNLLSGEHGVVRLEPRQVDLLLFLARHRGEVLGADRIIDTVWQGQVVTDQSVYQAIAKLRRALDDDAQQPRYIETVPKRGYRLIADVTFAPVEAPAPVGTATVTSPQRPRNPAWLADRRLAWAAAALLLLAAAAGMALRPAASPLPTVLVLPFDALTGNAHDSLVGEGFAIELAHAIGRSGRVRVIGPASARAAADAAANDAAAMAVDVVVSGSLRSSGDGYRIAARLVDADSGVQLWSEAFDSDTETVLRAQQRVAAALADALSRSLRPAFEATQPTLPAGGIGVYDEYLLGRYYRNRRSGADLERAIAHFSRALARDPDYLPAMRGIAGAYLLSSFYGSLPLTDAVAAATSQLRRATSLAGEDPEVLALFGLMDYLQGSYGQAADHLSRAVALHANLGEGWMWLGLALRQQGKLAEALAAFRRAGELEPLLVTAAVNQADALAWSGAGEDGLARLLELADRAHDGFSNRDQLYRAISGLLRDQGRLDEAYAWAHRAIALAPESPLSLANLASVTALLGRDAEAAGLARRALGDSPAGRGTMEYLARLAIVMPDLMPEDGLLQDHGFTDAAGQPEIEWRLARLYAGMRAYVAGEHGEAARHLQAAFDGRSYPVSRVDYDVYACVSLADALERSGRPADGRRQRLACRDALTDARREGWDTLALSLAELRLELLAGRREPAIALLRQLFDAGLRNAALLEDDPLLASLADTPGHARLVARIGAAVAAANQAIDAAGSP